MTPARREAPLRRDDVVAAAIALVDAHGLRALSMRRLGEALGVEAMSLYTHVANKDDLLGAMVDAVFAKMSPAPAGTHWRAALTTVATSKRAVLRRHPWALPLLDSRRAPGHATLAHHDALLGCLRGAGFSVPATGHVYALLDSFVYGFALQEASLLLTDPDDSADLAREMLERLPADTYPHLVELVTAQAARSGHSFADEFAVGLELLLDACAGIHVRENGAS
ncbi:TetR/AcrR family transcriptional regulator [Oerskovia flava]|uniref:TetR/AcrR family transcriptional regulator n=1 Tax=Oerskovia flava TaxID=2986422 RepID=UPI00223FD0EB|nr:TetR/AcrR family transcriptional regulator [Oerskovia sp. JB1-3-2]